MHTPKDCKHNQMQKDLLPLLLYNTLQLGELYDEILAYKFKYPVRQCSSNSEGKADGATH